MSPEKMLHYVPNSVLEKITPFVRLNNCTTVAEKVRVKGERVTEFMQRVWLKGERVVDRVRVKGERVADRVWVKGERVTEFKECG